jgi:hypothetical protein
MLQKRLNQTFDDLRSSTSESTTIKPTAMTSLLSSIVTPQQVALTVISEQTILQLLSSADPLQSSPKDD